MRSDNERHRFEVLIQRPWFVLGSSLKRVVAGVGIAVLVFWGGGVLDWLVTRAYLPRISMMLGGAAIAVIVGYLVFRILTDIYQRYRELLDRLQRIAELNHEVRNSLQVIAYYNVPNQAARAIAQVNAEIANINSCLREISVALGQRESIRAPVGEIHEQKDRR
jgi:hypothetical protein